MKTSRLIPLFLLTAAIGCGGPKVTMESKDGKFEGQADLGIPFFPGSEAMPSGRMRSSNAEGFVVTCNRTTTESPEKVVEFYKYKLKDAKPSVTTADGSTMASIGGKLDSGADVAITDMKTKEDKTATIAIIVSTKTSKP